MSGAVQDALIERVKRLHFNHNSFAILKGIAIKAIQMGTEDHPPHITPEEKAELLDLIDEITLD